jgi:hypothetical protein
MIADMDRLPTPQRASGLLREGYLQRSTIRMKGLNIHPNISIIKKATIVRKYIKMIVYPILRTLFLN